MTTCRNVKLVCNRVLVSARITTTKQLYYDIGIEIGRELTLTDDELAAILELYRNNEIPTVDYSEENKESKPLDVFSQQTLKVFDSIGSGKTPETKLHIRTDGNVGIGGDIEDA